MFFEGLCFPKLSIYVDHYESSSSNCKEGGYIWYSNIRNKINITTKTQLDPNGPYCNFLRKEPLSGKTNTLFFPGGFTYLVFYGVSKKQRINITISVESDGCEGVINPCIIWCLHGYHAVSTTTYSLYCVQLNSGKIITVITVKRNNCIIVQGFQTFHNIMLDFCGFKIRNKEIQLGLTFEPATTKKIGGAMCSSSIMLWYHTHEASAIDKLLKYDHVINQSTVLDLSFMEYRSCHYFIFRYQFKLLSKLDHRCTKTIGTNSSSLFLPCGIINVSSSILY